MVSAGLFLYTYSSEEDYVISRQHGLFGAPEDEAGLATRVKELRPRDVILIRDSRWSRGVRLFGCCEVVRGVFDRGRADLSSQINYGRTRSRSGKSSTPSEWAWTSHCTRQRRVSRCDGDNSLRLGFGAVVTNASAEHKPGQRCSAATSLKLRTMSRPYVSCLGSSRCAQRACSSTPALTEQSWFRPSTSSIPAQDRRFRAGPDLDLDRLAHQFLGSRSVAPAPIQPGRSGT